ncbi:hypothetical protein J751_3624 [Acinetobacter baumannii 24812_8]|nr:hypothetical protein J751_3624 [Acinetobacter baumannii 24812_8]
MHLLIAADSEYQKKLDTLLQRVKDSKTPDEVTCNSQTS